MSASGPDHTMTYSFRVAVSGEDGTYFPVFTVSTVEAGSISYPFELEVDSKDLEATVVDRPDNFVVGKKDSVNLSLVNSRNGALTDITITPDRKWQSPSHHVRNLLPHLPQAVHRWSPFQVTPDQASDLTFHITYHNGNNDHSVDEVLPLNIGEDKTGCGPRCQ